MKDFKVFEHSLRKFAPIVDCSVGIQINLSIFLVISRVEEKNKGVPRTTAKLCHSVDASFIKISCQCIQKALHRIPHDTHTYPRFVLFNKCYFWLCPTVGISSRLVGFVVRADFFSMPRFSADSVLESAMCEDRPFDSSLDWTYICTCVMPFPDFLFSSSPFWS